MEEENLVVEAIPSGYLKTMYSTSSMQPPSAKSGSSQRLTVSSLLSTMTSG
uniref:Uncharacterized protein n=1 Tax=Arundo donax TaxID=35708 RepID=A0A0A9AMQ5_ARUDO